jgi:imidazolonepropionase-like amidohydrolase
LTDKGVKTLFKSDHPVLNSQNLIYEAAKGHHYGLSAELAMKSVTSVPAERMGQDHRIGYVNKGYDADLVIWDKYGTFN